MTATIDFLIGVNRCSMLVKGDISGKNDIQCHAPSVEAPTVNTPTIGVVLLYYQFWPGVCETIDALLTQTLPAKEILLVDNASGDGCLAKINVAYPTLHVIANPINGGYAGGMNLGMRSLRHRYDYLLFITHECILAADAIEHMVSVLSSEDRLGCVGPLLGYANARGMVFSAGVDVTRLRHRTVHCASPRRMEDWAHCAPRLCDALDGACLLMKEVAFAEVGPFDEGYFLYFEETDLLLRMKHYGWHVRCVPRAMAWQQPGKRPPLLWTRNRLRFVYRNFGTVSLLLETAAQAIKAFKLLLSDANEAKAEGRAVVGGMLGFFQGMPPKTLL